MNTGKIRYSKKKKKKIQSKNRSHKFKKRPSNKQKVKWIF